MRCPQNCGDPSKKFAIVAGASIHPGVSSICDAAVHDGVLTVSGQNSVTLRSESRLHSFLHLAGGVLALTVTGPLPSYSGIAVKEGKRIAACEGRSVLHDGFECSSLRHRRLRETRADNGV